MSTENTKQIQQYDDLASELQQRVDLLLPNSQIWIGLAGAPGSGKSTLAEALKERLRQLLLVIPMDGYHYYRSELNAMKNPAEAFARRGAPFTFNSKKFVTDLLKARESGEGSFPDFDHSAGDPVEGEIHLTYSHKIVIVEGNYVLLDTEPWAQLHQRVFDETWYLDVSVEESNRRVRKRHIQLGLTEEEAEHRIATNDGINAELIAEVSPTNADRLIKIKS